MDVVRPLTSPRSHSCSHGVACTLFNIRLSADAPPKPGTEVVSLSYLVSHRGAVIAAGDCIPMYRDQDAHLSPYSDHHR